jgi:nucleoside-diphosphate-sugar epimerase
MVNDMVVLGSNGHLGAAAAAAFAAAGWRVTGLARTPQRALEGVRVVAGDADSVDDLRRAIGDAPVVLHALNLPYDKWDNGRLERQTARVLEAVGREGRTLLFPGNVYNYAAGAGVLTPETPQQPQTPRGAIRVRVEALLAEAAARGDIQAILLRAGDFYGPGARGDWFDQVLLRSLAKGRISLIGTPGVGHAWAYLPDLARGFERLAALRRTLGPFETFHFAGHFVTPEVLGQALGAALPGARLTRFPLALLQLAGLFDAATRGVARMDYLWRRPLELRDPRLAVLIGPDSATPFAAAIAATVAAFPGVTRPGGQHERRLNANLMPS